MTTPSFAGASRPSKPSVRSRARWGERWTLFAGELRPCGLRFDHRNDHGEMGYRGDGRMIRPCDLIVPSVGWPSHRGG